MTRPGIEPRSPGPLVNTLTIMPMSGIVIDKQRFLECQNPDYLQSNCTSRVTAQIRVKDLPA